MDGSLRTDDHICVCVTEQHIGLLKRHRCEVPLGVKQGSLIDNDWKINIHQSTKHELVERALHQKAALHSHAL